jgi:O-antigen/teichoic acid export membrane protein
MLNVTTSTAERVRRLSSEGVWIIFGQAAAVVGSLAGVRLLTELLDPHAYGELALAMTVAALVNQVVLGPLSNGATRFYAPAAEQGDLAGFLSAIHRLLALCAGVIGVVVLAALAVLTLTDRTDLAGVTLAASTFALLSGCNAILSGMQNAARQRSLAALHQGAEPWARFLVAAALLLAFHGASATAMWGYALASFLVLASQYMFFRRTIPHSGAAVTSENWQQRMWRYSWPFSTWGVFTWMQLASDRWALEHFGTTRDVGLYVVLYQLGYYPISLATGMAVQFLAPIVYQRAGDARDGRRNANVNRLTWRLTALALGMTGIATLLAFALQREIFALLVSEQYASVAKMLPLVALSGGLFAAGQALSLQLTSLMKTQAMVGAKIGSALLGTILNVAGAFWFGIAGVVLAGLAFSLCYLVWMALLCWRTGQAASATVDEQG